MEKSGLKNSRICHIGKHFRWRICGFLMSVLWLASPVLAEGGVVGELKKSLSPHESLLIKLFFGLLFFLVGLVVWEFFARRESSHSSLDIAKLAAAAAKKKTSAKAPVSSSLSGIEEKPTGRSFAPPPPPPPQKLPSSAPSVPSGNVSGEKSPADNPFAPPAPKQTATSASSEQTVSFSPSSDSGGSGDWSDLLDRVRAGEPEAGGFNHQTPPPSTEQENSPVFGGPTSPPAASSGFSFPAAEATPFGGQASSAPAVPDSSSSSEAWEALLKKTTHSGDEMPSPSSGVAGVGLTSSQAPFVNELASTEPPALSQDSPFSLSPSTDIQIPETSSGESTSPFSFPQDSQGTEPSPNFQFPASPGVTDEATPFSLPQAGSTGSTSPSFEQSPNDTAPSFSLPVAGAEADMSSPLPVPESPATSFQLPSSSSGSVNSSAGTLPLPDMFSGSSEPSQDVASSEGMSGTIPLTDMFSGSPETTNPFSSGDAAQSSTVPLGDMFSGSGESSTGVSFQLPSTGQGATPSAPTPFDFPGAANHSFDPEAGRTISLDFSQGLGQMPPPPQPKTEG